MTTPPKPDHEKRPFRFKLEGPFLRVSTMLLITPISPNFKGLKCSVFGRFRALQSRKIYGATVVAASAAGFGDELKSYNSAKNSASLGNFDKVNDRYLKKNGIDAHRLKEEVLGGKTRIAEYDIYKNKDTGELYIFKKGGKGAGIPTELYLK